MIKYIHGSQDSLDVDVHYVLDKLPSFSECVKICNSNENENINVITIQNGIVTDCFKGTIDEVNNGLLDTYFLHKQDSELLVKRKIDRDIFLKDIRVIRCLLSYFSRTEYRTLVKEALKSNSLGLRLKVLKEINFLNINDYKKNDIIEVYKVFAFQLGQILALKEGVELYTKHDVAYYYPELKSYLYREDSDNNNLFKFYISFLMSVENENVVEYEDFVITKDNKKFDLKKEIYL